MTRAPKKCRASQNAIREGAEAFLARQYKTIAMLTIPVAVIIYLLYALRHSSGQENITTSQLALYVAGSFIFGAICSGIAGYVGMWVAIRSNIRTAAASRSSLNWACRLPCVAAPSPGCSWWS
jgi:K(+)-stimulated pyrophosphate-energized sodium pump